MAVSFGIVQVASRLRCCLAALNAQPCVAAKSTASSGEAVLRACGTRREGARGKGLFARQTGRGLSSCGTNSD
eukprot:656866-Pleurochrysis_carterae.AAC.2